MSEQMDWNERGVLPNEKTESDRVSSLYEWMEAAIFSLVVVVLIFSFLCRIVGVDGDSMQYTLIDHDRLIVSRLPYEPQHGDIVIINRYHDEPLVKRVIATGGDTIEIRDEQVNLNEELLMEPYLPEGLKTPPYQMSGPLYIPEGYIFVMGDNRGNSHDSRSGVPGLQLVDVRNVMGKAVLRIWPFNTFGGLYS